MARLTYKAAGVDIELKERLVPLFRKLARPTLGAHVLGGVGGFGAIVGLNGAAKLREPVLVAGADGVGTKLKIAFATGRHNTIGIDLVAMCVNDIICHNARPLFFLDYIGCGKLNPRVATAIIEGIARGCRLAGASLVGGETAQMPGLYQKGEYDLAGFAVGIAERSKIPRPTALRAGDVVIGLASNGLHSNGFSLARKVLFERGRLRLSQRIPELGCALADELLRPTTIYARIAAELFEKCALKGLANVTGGGIPENLPRIMPAGLYAEIRRGSWQTPPIFDLIQRIGRIAQAEMDRTFNNGLGMIAIVAARDADAAMVHLKRRRGSASPVGASIIGTLCRGARGVKIR